MDNKRSRAYEVEKIRLEVVKYHSNKVNQHVYYIISFSLGSLTYLSRITNIMSFIETHLNFNLLANLVFSLLPLLFIFLLLLYSLGRTYYWDLLLGQASILNYNLEYEKQKDHPYFKVWKSALEDNVYWTFQILARIGAEESCKRNNRVPKYILASFFTPGNRRLFSIVKWYFIFFIIMILTFNYLNFFKIMSKRI